MGANAKDGLERIHPTQKPVYLYAWIIDRYVKNKGGGEYLTHISEVVQSQSLVTITVSN